MNRKIKNYVDVLFNDVPKTRKAVELKEEILADLNEHFEAHISEGKSENQAYTEALGDMGDIDELLSSLAPERELKPKIDEYRIKKAQNTSIAVMVYILGVILLCALPAISNIFGIWEESKSGILGFILMMICVAIATGLLIYTKMSVPQDVEPFLTKKARVEFSEDVEKSRFWEGFFKLYWMIVTIIYLLISFTSGDWHITWIIWLIGAAVKQAIILFAGPEAKEADED
ncbi:MAG: permease prefix domain 1-containing protein [Treponema sp.]|nr:permease prefix domain 1-containing protein [Treponema sp.]